MYADQIRVTDEWFVPHFPARQDRPLEIAMVAQWKEFMSYEDHHSCGWTTRLVAHVLAPIPNGLNMRTAKVAATFALWCLTPNGRGFIDPLLRKIRDAKGAASATDTAVAAWAVENRLGLLTNNRLESLLLDKDGHPFYKRKPYPSLADNRAVEQTLCFLVGESGRSMLKRVCHASNQPNWLPL